MRSKVVRWYWPFSQLLLCLLIVLWSGVLCLAFVTVLHEVVHEDVCKYNGGVATVTYGRLLLSGWTSCSVHTAGMVEPNSLNEVAGALISSFVIAVHIFAAAWLLIRYVSNGGVMSRG